MCEAELFRIGSLNTCLYCLLWPRFTKHHHSRQNQHPIRLHCLKCLNFPQGQYQPDTAWSLPEHAMLCDWRYLFDTFLRFCEGWLVNQSLRQHRYCHCQWCHNHCSWHHLFPSQLWHGYGRWVNFFDTFQRIQMGIFCSHWSLWSQSSGVGHWRQQCGDSPRPCLLLQSHTSFWNSLVKNTSGCPIFRHGQQHYFCLRQ